MHKKPPAGRRRSGAQGSGLHSDNWTAIQLSQRKRGRRKKTVPRIEKSRTLDKQIREIERLRKSLLKGTKKVGKRAQSNVLAKPASTAETLATNQRSFFSPDRFLSRDKRSAT
jgi:hypothetical protein